MYRIISNLGRTLADALLSTFEKAVADSWGEALEQAEEEEMCEINLTENGEQLEKQSVQKGNFTKHA